MIGRRTPRAGVYAEQRYQRALRSWREKNSALLAAICTPFIVAGIVVLGIDKHGVSWLGGGLVGMFGMLWLVFRETPPRYIEKWHDGAEGERKTEKALRPLEKAGWRVMHDIQSRYGNYDHVAIGPAGVYLLETKNLQGIVHIQNGVPCLDRRHDPEASEAFERIRPRTLSAARRIKEDIQRRGGCSTWVQAVVVFWSEFPEGVVEDRRCVYIHGSRLRAWLSERPQRLDPARIGKIATAIELLADEAEPRPARNGPV